MKIYVYASERSERDRKLWHLYILKVLYFFQYFVGTSVILSVQMICLWYGAIYKRQSTDKALTWNLFICERARKFWNFYILLKVLLVFLSIFCRYFRYFVGTNDMFWALFWHFYILKVLFLSIFCRYKWYAYGMALYINASIPTKH